MVVEVEVPSAGAVIAAESAGAAIVVSVVAGTVVSVLTSVVVVSVSAGFDSQEVRAAANTKARADTFRKFFILVLGLKSCLKNVLHTHSTER